MQEFDCFMIISPQEFTNRFNTHSQEVRAKISSYLAQREQGKRHPVLDFLFEYYQFRPSMLERYSAGFKTKISTSNSADLSTFLPHYPLYRNENEFWIMDLNQFPHHRFDALVWLIGLLEKTQFREPQFSCLGMHEWAMVYKQETAARYTIPFRLSIPEMQAFVESRPIRCSHYDAFRFFTPDAIPLNKIQPSLELREELEQPGCIHTNMDVYRWAFKFYPWVSSDLIWEAFNLAYEARFIDMRASPYNLQEFDVIPICIETKSGAEEYVFEQKRLSERAFPIREKLISELKGIRAGLELIKS